MSPKSSNSRNRALRIGEAAALVKASVDSLREWDRSGLLPARRTAKGHRRYALDDLEAFMQRGAGKGATAPREDPLAGSSLGEVRAARGSVRVQAQHVRPEMTMPWDDEVAEARAELEVARARRELGALNRMAKENSDEVARRAEAERERCKMDQRIEKFKSFGRDLAADLPVDARARIVALLEEWVTDQQFPRSMSDQDGYALVRDRVAQVRAEVERAREQARAAGWASLEKQIEDSRRKDRIEELIRVGREAASTESIGWGYSDRQRAIQSIERELCAEVESDWTEEEVREFVMDIFDEWEDDVEDDDDNGEAGEEDDDGEDGW